MRTRLCTIIKEKMQAFLTRQQVRQKLLVVCHFLIHYLAVGSYIFSLNMISDKTHAENGQKERIPRITSAFLWQNEYLAVYGTCRVRVVVFQSRTAISSFQVIIH